VVELLRREILEGERKPGERIRQEAVARACGTSRIPVRQALHQLQSEGLITWTAHVGARVAKLDLAELDEIYLIRERLEPLALAQSVPRLTDDQRNRLRGYVEQMESVANERNPSHWVSLDRDFHLSSYSAANMPRLLTMIEGLWNATQQYRRVYAGLPHRLDLAHAEHRLLIEAIERRDPDDAARLGLAHIRRTRLTLDRHPEIFEGETGSSGNGRGSGPQPTVL
jgi:DNA-binding GntR family transcriptional regulator